MSELERTLESIRDIGPQRATPSSVARIQAQAKQLAAEVDELRDREVSVGSMDDFADMAKQIAALREELARLRDERAVHVGEIEHLYKENNQLQAELDAWKESQ